MKELLNSLVAEVNSRTHLVPLLKKTDLTILMTTGKEEFYLIIEEGKLRSEESVEKDADVFIEGNPDSIRLLLTGKMKLREAVKQELLKLDASFRVVLFLESLFLLGFPEREEHAKK